MISSYQQLPDDIKQELKHVAETLVNPPKGILTADESIPTLNKRLRECGVTNVDENSRRSWRKILFSVDYKISNYISGVVVSDETLCQKDEFGKLLVDYLRDRNILVGIKIDLGLVKIPFSQNEVVTQGTDNLMERIVEYKKHGCVFARWRCFFKIDKQTPSYHAIKSNLEMLARFAAICQVNNICPLVETEVCPDGTHDLPRCQEITDTILSHLFRILNGHHVYLEGMLLKVNMVTAGMSHNPSAPDMIGKATVEVLSRTVPPAVSGICFSSDGQNEEEAPANLHAIQITEGRKPWKLTFAYGRPLQSCALKIWGGNDHNVKAAQEEFLRQAAVNSQALATQRQFMDHVGDSPALYTTTTDSPSNNATYVQSNTESEMDHNEIMIKGNREYSDNEPDQNYSTAAPDRSEQVQMAPNQQHVPPDKNLLHDKKQYLSSLQAPQEYPLLCPPLQDDYGLISKDLNSSQQLDEKLHSNKSQENHLLHADNTFQADVQPDPTGEEYCATESREDCVSQSVNKALPSDKLLGEQYSKESVENLHPRLNNAILPSNVRSSRTFQEQTYQNNNGQGTTYPLTNPPHKLHKKPNISNMHNKNNGRASRSLTPPAKHMIDSSKLYKNDVLLTPKSEEAIEHQKLNPSRNFNNNNSKSSYPGNAREINVNFSVNFDSSTGGGINQRSKLISSKVSPQDQTIKDQSLSVLSIPLLREPNAIQTNVPSPSKAVNTSKPELENDNTFVPTDDNDSPVSAPYSEMSTDSEEPTRAARPTKRVIFVDNNEQQKTTTKKPVIREEPSRYPKLPKMMTHVKRTEVDDETDFPLPPKPKTDSSDWKQYPPVPKMCSKQVRSKCRRHTRRYPLENPEFMEPDNAPCLLNPDNGPNVGFQGGQSNPIQPKQYDNVKPAEELEEIRSQPDDCEDPCFPRIIAPDIDKDHNMDVL